MLITTTGEDSLYTYPLHTHTHKEQMEPSSSCSLSLSLTLITFENKKEKVSRQIRFLTGHIKQYVNLLYVPYYILCSFDTCLAIVIHSVNVNNNKCYPRTSMLHDRKKKFTCVASARKKSQVFCFSSHHRGRRQMQTRN